MNMYMHSKQIKAIHHVMTSWGELCLSSHCGPGAEKKLIPPFPRKAEKNILNIYNKQFHIQTLLFGL